MNSFSARKNPAFHGAAAMSGDSAAATLNSNTRYRRDWEGGKAVCIMCKRVISQGDKNKKPNELRLIWPSGMRLISPT